MYLTISVSKNVKYKIKNYVSNIFLKGNVLFTEYNSTDSYFCKSSRFCFIMEHYKISLKIILLP